MTYQTDTPILIVGGGPVGLILALDLARRKCRSILVDQDPCTAPVLLAKAGTLNERTLEYCRQLGIAQQVANVGFPDDFSRDTVYCTSLNGFLIGRSPMPSTNERTLPEGCVEMLRKCPQHLFDPLLANAVEEAGLTEIRYNTRFEGLDRTEECVAVRLSNVETGEKYVINAQYVIGCDGAGSAVRRAVDIGFSGEQLDYSISAMIEVDQLDKYHEFGACERYMFLDTGGTWANLTSVDGRKLWRFTMVGSEEELNPETLDIEPVIRRAFGRDDVPFEVLRVVPWRRSQFAADRYKEGRVLLGGDACHTTSPTGGHGLNTGVGDAISLGWMLDAVLKGWGGTRLLEAYGLERRPIAIRNSSSSTRNYKAWVKQSGREKILDESEEGAAARRRIGEELTRALDVEWNSVGVGMGYRYEGSPIIVPDGTPEPPDDPSKYVQTARPGHHAPHAWLERGKSTVDLFGKGFVLLRFGTTPVDAAEFTKAAAARDIPFSVVDIDRPDIAAIYERALVLVRPDSHVAWRGDEPPQDIGRLWDVVRGEIFETLS